MLRIARDDRPDVLFEFEGETLTAKAGDTLAAALLASGHRTFRATPVSGAPRGPLCMMGVCFDCLVEIDGAANRQACMTEVLDGMRVRCQDGANDISTADGTAEATP